MTKAPEAELQKQKCGGCKPAKPPHLHYWPSWYMLWRGIDAFLHLFWRATWKVAEGTLSPLIQIFNKDIKQNWLQSRALGSSSSQPDVNPFATSLRGSAIQTAFNSAKYTPVQAMDQEMAAGRVSLAKGICCAFLTWGGCNLTARMWGCIRTRSTGHYILGSTWFPCCFTCDRLQELLFQHQLMPSQKPQEVLINRIHAGLGLSRSPPFC